MPSSHPISIPTFATHQLSLLAAELAAETDSTATLLSTSSPTTLSRAGLAITNLSLSSIRTGLGGKSVLELEPDSAIAGASERGGKGGGGSENGNGGEGGSGGGGGLEHGIRVGDVVRVAPQPRGGERKGEKKGLEGKGVDGVVVRVGGRGGGVQVALEREAEVEENLGAGRVWVVKLANEVTYKRMNWTMERMQKMQDADHSTLMRVLFGMESPTPLPVNLEDPERGSGKVEFFDPTLNDSQKDAVRFALASKEVALIHGPPGTGKTYTLIELILQLLQRKKRVLVCGPSNISVDNIVERLAPHKVPIIRLGHPARLLPSVLSHSLDVLTRTSEAAALVKDIRKEMDDKQASIKKTRNGRERKAIYGEIKELRSEYREREKKCVGTLVQGSKVVLATLHGSGGFQLRSERFDVVIIDEASQALEAQCWVALLNASKVVLAGDHLQLPPTIKSTNSKTASNPKDKDKDKKKPKEKEKTKEKEKPEEKDQRKTSASYPKEPTAPPPQTLETTLFSRLLSLHGSSIKHMLTTQYRMHSTIMSFPSTTLYENKLIAAPSVASRVLKDLPYPVTDTEDTREPLVFWDTQGGDFPEKVDDDDNNAGDSSVSGKKKVSKGSLLGDSKSNPTEALLVKLHVRRLLAAGVSPSDIAVITPYNAQLSLLSSLLHHHNQESFAGIELGSVDGFQGREKEAVVVSLVRSNSEHEVGFLADKRRLNVAMTRPKRHLCVVGDSETVGRGGGGFLKGWMGFLEERADLRYPDLGEVLREGEGAEGWGL